MANRHLARSIAMQSLFECDFRNLSAEDEIHRIIDDNIVEFGPGLDERGFVENLVFGVIEKKDTLDEIIEKAAKDWPLENTPVVDRNVLRLGLFELLFSNKDEVPARVAINEAIELAKNFGGDKSGKFINGVLGTIYKEMGEPGKFDEPKKKKKKKKEDLTKEEIEKLPLEKLAGAVVCHKDSSDNLMFALVHDIFGYWTLSKGHVEDDEKEAEGVIREIKGEIGLDVAVKNDLSTNEYIANDPEVGFKRKRVTYFLVEAKRKDDLKLKESGGLDDVRWFTPGDVEDLKTYDDIRPIIEKGLEILKKEKNKK